MYERNTILILWPKFDYCEQMRYGREICSGLSKFYRLFFKSGLDAMNNINLLLLYSFLISFIGFIVAVTISFFEPNQNVSNLQFTYIFMII